MEIPSAVSGSKSAFRPRVVFGLLVALTVAPSDGAAAAAAAGEPYGGLSPEEERRSFRIAAGFRIDLVLHEPEVQDPVAVAWDERGRLWVVEMSDYPVREPVGRVKWFEDADGDGRYERSAVFAERLPYPTSVLPHRGGVLVAAAPDILFLEDSDDDGRADRKRAILTGFHPGNTQLRANGLLYGLDGRIYGANGRSGGKIRRPSDPNDPSDPADPADPDERAVDIGQRDFRFDAQSYLPEAIAGPSQFGHGFDAWGRRFLSWNTVHIRQEMLSLRDLERHPRLLRTATVAAISDHGDAARIFSLVPPPRTFNNEPTDHFNASCGLTIECGGLFRGPYADCAYVCEPLVGIVHRDRLDAGSGPAMRASRGEDGVEFLASTDPWFHPVNLRSGPDGALYVVDFYREMVEHPEYVAAALRAGVDFARGHGHGRIWRILPEGNAPRPVEDLGSLSVSELVERLKSLSAPVRQTAQRLIAERGDAAARGPLSALAAGDAPPLARAAALWTLRGLGLLDAAALRPVFSASEPRLRETALRIAREDKKLLEALAREVEGRAADPDASVRFHAALALGDLATEVSVWSRIARRDGGDPWFQAAIVSGLSGREAAFVLACVEPAERPVAFDLLREAASLAGAGASIEEIDRVRDFLAPKAPEAERDPDGPALNLVEALLDGLGRSGRLPGASWGAVFARAAVLARDGARPAAIRASAASILGHAPIELAESVLAALIDPRLDKDIQIAALRALGRRPSERVPVLILRAWPSATPQVRAAALGTLLGRREWAEQLLDALERGEVRARDLDPARREALRRALAPERAARLASLSGAAPSSRGDVIERYKKETAAGDRVRGGEVFRRNCASCHRVAFGAETVGHAVGPDLAGAGRKSRDDLLAAILDPARAVVAGYEAYVIREADGRISTGILAAETARTITLRGAEGVETTIDRDRIREIASTGSSLMPEGIETAIDPKAMADLLEFLRGL